MNTSTPPGMRTIDHVHVHVADRDASEAWYSRVLGFARTEKLEFWAANGGPLMMQNAEGTVCIALFERSPTKTHSTIALRVSSDEYVDWNHHLAHELDEPPESEDHEVSLSLYFADPDRNPYEITTYDIVAARKALAANTELCLSTMKAHAFQANLGA